MAAAWLAGSAYDPGAADLAGDGSVGFTEFAGLAGVVNPGTASAIFCFLVPLPLPADPEAPLFLPALAVSFFLSPFLAFEVLFLSFAAEAFLSFFAASFLLLLPPFLSLPVSLAAFLPSLDSLAFLSFDLASDSFFFGFLASSAFTLAL